MTLNSFFKTAFITLTLVSGLAAQAECIPAEPVCKAMNKMANGMDCLQHKLPPGMCYPGNLIQNALDIQQGAKDARVALLNRSSFTDEQKVEINQLFDQMDVQTQLLVTNFDDQALRDQALKSISAIRKKGHMDFQDQN